MRYLEYPLWLAEQAISALLYFWPVTLVLAVAFAIALALKSPFTISGSFRRRHLSVFLPLLVTLLILIWGTVMHDSQTSWPDYIVDALVITQFSVGIWVIWFMKGYRWFSVFAVALQQWLGLACAFVAGMSVTGDWL
jgi:hypothetical protein